MLSLRICSYCIHRASEIVSQFFWISRRHLLSIGRFSEWTAVPSRREARVRECDAPGRQSGLWLVRGSKLFFRPWVDVWWRGRWKLMRMESWRNTDRRQIASHFSRHRCQVAVSQSFATIYFSISPWVNLQGRCYSRRKERLLDSASAVSCLLNDEFLAVFCMCTCMPIKWCSRFYMHEYSMCIVICSSFL